MAADRTAPSGRIYQLHIALRGIRPPIWRRVQVPSSFTLAKVHETIQMVFGWTDTHLHKFYVDGTAYGKPDFDEDVLNEAETRLAQTRLERFTYVYDFGD